MNQAGSMEFPIRRLGGRGLSDATGEVGDADPLEAANQVLETEDFDEVILSTLPAGISRWVHMDLPHRLGEKVDIPVVHVSGPNQTSPIRPETLGANRRPRPPARVRGGGCVRPWCSEGNDRGR